MLRNPAYKGEATFGKPRVPPGRQQLRPARGRPEHPRRRRPPPDTEAGEPITIPVPAIVDAGLFAAAQEQLEESRARSRTGARGARHLLQGLLVCGACGYALCGKACRRPAAGGKERAYAYYRCCGTEPHRFGGERVCRGRQVRSDLLDAAVWEDVRSLLSDPERLREEYEGRLRRRDRGGVRETGQLRALIQRARRGVSRLIDAFGDGLLEREEFEPRLRAARERLVRLEQEERTALGRDEEAAALRLVIGQLEGFARRVKEGLHEADWETRREVIRALVKRVEGGDEEARVVYKVSPPTLPGGPGGGVSPDCTCRVGPPPGVQPAPHGDGRRGGRARDRASAGELQGGQAGGDGVRAEARGGAAGGPGGADRRAAGGDRSPPRRRPPGAVGAAGVEATAEAGGPPDATASRGQAA
jgi:site-specific DNA recombinase